MVSAELLTQQTQMTKKHALFMSLGQRRTQQNKRWETDILHQVAVVRAWEDEALRRDIEAWFLTIKDKEQELLVLLKILDHKFQSEVTQARAYETKAHRGTELPISSEGRKQHQLRQRKAWYLDKAQQHHNQAQQLLVVQEELEEDLLQCMTSLHQYQVWVPEALRQRQEDSMRNIPMVVRGPSKGGPRVSNMMRLALHNNLMALLEWQKVRTALQEATTMMQETLCRQQQERTILIQKYYKTLQDVE